MKIRRRLVVPIAILVVGIVLAITILLAGEFGALRVFRELTPPLLVVILLEFTALGLLAASFLVRKGRRRIPRLVALGIVVLLVAGFLLEPLRPVSMPPNHPDDDWDAGRVVHILPTASESRFLIKVSFVEPVSSPRLIARAAGGPGAGGPALPATSDAAPRPGATRDATAVATMTDTAGTNWRFDVDGLAPDTEYILSLSDGEAVGLCDPWPLATLPAADAEPGHLRILAIEGSGGHDAAYTWYGKGQMPHSYRVAMLNRALSFEPDAIFASGDQVYYDLKYGIGPKVFGMSRRARFQNGEFDWDAPPLGSANEAVLKRSAGMQIANLFGTAARSVPGFFVMDDHDYYVNDEARASDEINLQLLLAWMNPIVEGGISLPPEPFLLELARATQALYYPEFLPHDTRPADLPGSGDPDRAPGVSETFGTLRYGRLFEGVIYDVRRFLSVDGEEARFFPREVEDWVISRARETDAAHFVHLSPFAYGFGAAKWQSWYPDVRTMTSRGPVLTTETEKYLWQPGWFLQHNRILASLADSPASPLLVNGDVHAQAAGLIRRSGTLDLSSRPVPTVLMGSIGVNGGGYPSGGMRGIPAQPPSDLDVEVLVDPVEAAGFLILDVTPDEVVVRMFTWRYGRDDPAAIETLEPYETLRFPRI